MLVPKVIQVRKEQQVIQVLKVLKEP
jgi:hypothetical protein